VVTASDYKDRSFSEAFGLRMAENGLLARAVYVVGPDGVIRYEQIVPEVATEPDYDAALSAAREAAG
jgi:thiol peroxidase